MLDRLPYDPELRPGARNAVEVCLAVQPGERLSLITDMATLEIAASLVDAAVRAGADIRYYVLEEEARRPLLRCPPSVLAAAAQSDVVISCFQPQPGEIESRAELVQVIETRRIRYAHMVWISSTIMQQSMRADYRQVDQLSRRLIGRVHSADRIVVKSRAGTDIEAQFDDSVPWIKTSGLVDPAYWSNLPGGEVWTVPATVNGIFVADGAVGDYLCPKYGDISGTPLTIEIEDGLLRDARCENLELLADFIEYCRRAPYGDRIGEFAFGTNIGITGMIGNLLQDEKVPGIHIAFGNTCQNLTGALWTSTTHIDAISRETNVWVDGESVMDTGRYLI